MKTFLRFVAIIFFLVLVIVIITSKNRTPSSHQGSDINSEDTSVEETAASEEEIIGEDEPVETLEDIVDATTSEEDGPIILGGDGIPNN